MRVTPIADRHRPLTDRGKKTGPSWDNPEAGYALGYHRYLFEGDRPADWFIRTRVEDSEPGYSPSVWMVRRSTWEQVGAFEPGRRLGEEGLGVVSGDDDAD